MPEIAMTCTDIRDRKKRGDRVVMITAYDASFAALLDPVADILLVGDSLGMVVQGHQDTLPVTLEHMIYHTACVTRATRHAVVVADMPFMTYQVSPEQALVSAGRLLQEGRAQGVKLEGGTPVLRQVERLAGAGIPVMGHLGLTPQSIHQLGGFRVQAREPSSARQLLDDAHALAAAGCFALVLESIPAELSAEVTAQLEIPTIGIGAGPACDGQVLVCYDLLGMNASFQPRFVKRYAELHRVIADAVRGFAEDVRAGSFPTSEHSFHAPRPASATKAAVDHGRSTS